MAGPERGGGKMHERLILSAILIVCGALTGLAAADGTRRKLRLLSLIHI